MGRCGKQHDRSSMGLHCSHHHGRSRWGVRFDPLNAEALCYGCHSHHGGTEERRNEVMDRDIQDLLYEKISDVGLAKEYRRTKGKGPVAKHYRDEYQKMQDDDSYSFVGWI